MDHVEHTLEVYMKQNKFEWSDWDVIETVLLSLKNMFKKLKKAKRLNLNLPMLHVIGDYGNKDSKIIELKKSKMY
eukprot:CAMPEP_0116956120 /NCGR_PEP_ID=MMETSP0467-20121206/43112_1 /TAXON_ID=283647 /ORGANISM="Mesodinium pulex, Strain SPMC105" /LENGTH=74 /DNA_ID=CAMNT_0004642469 /DNA_START=347 /DNA_END=571 /DNA_ORIENTATION=-